MKTPLSKTPRENRKSTTQKPRPEIRDNLDSRMNEEQHLKGDDITHNLKPHHNIKPGRKQN